MQQEVPLTGLMAKKMGLSTLMLLLYMALYGGVMFLYISFLMNSLSGTAALVGNSIVFGGAFLFFIPWFIWTISVVWFFKGEGAPVALDVLKKELLSVKGFDVPVTAEEKDGAIVLTWRYLDAKWWELFAKAGVKKSYELVIKLDEAKKEARLIDITKSMSWRAGFNDLRFGGSYFRGIIWAVEVGKQWGIKENFTLGKVYDYKFQPSEIKNPVLNSILRAGWNVRFALY